MLTCVEMRGNSLVFAGLLLLVSACGARSVDQARGHVDWDVVVAKKQAASRPSATTGDKQAYADALAAFVQHNPDHGTAREIYRRIQVEFADDLSSLGRYQEAVRVYRSVLTHDPQNKRAEIGLRNAVDLLTVSHDRLARLEKGMSRRDVAAILGKPLPGWTVVHQRNGADIEAWYYRTARGGLAGIYFREGKLFAAEENSEQRLAHWNS